jgi:hypothetical protein
MRALARCAAVSALVLAAAGVARADAPDETPDTTADRTPDIAAAPTPDSSTDQTEKLSEISFDLAAWPSAVGNVFTFRLDGQIALGRHVALLLSLPASAGGLSGDADTHGSIGNPAAGLQFRWALPSAVRVELSAGFLIRVPTTWSYPATDDALGADSIGTLAAAATALYDADAFLPGIGSLRGWVHFDLSHAWWRVQTEAVLLGEFNARSLDPADALGDLAVGIQSATSFDAEVARGVRLGLRGLAVANAAIGNAVGGEPYLLVAPVESFYFRLGFLLSSSRLLPNDAEGLFDTTFRARVGVRF